MHFIWLHTSVYEFKMTKVLRCIIEDYRAKKNFLYDNFLKQNIKWRGDENDSLYLMIDFNYELQRCSPVDRYRSWWQLTEPTPHRAHLVLPHLLQRRKRGRVSRLILSMRDIKRNSLSIICWALIFSYFSVELVQWIPLFSEVEKQNCMLFEIPEFWKIK